jgi:hypothetical protein
LTAHHASQLLNTWKWNEYELIIGFFFGIGSVTGKLHHIVFTDLIFNWCSNPEISRLLGKLITLVVFLTCYFCHFTEIEIRADGTGIILAVILIAIFTLII